MSARSFGVITLVLPPEQRVNPTLQPVQANASFAFELINFRQLTTLSSNLGNNQNGQIEGLLYVPSIDPSDPCYNLSQPIVPENATRRTNIPTTEYSAIAIAPWINADCTSKYMSSVQKDSEFVRGLIFFQANDTSSPAETPPPVSNPIWGLNDGGKWKSRLGFPAYAIPGLTGRLLMENLAIYSGNVTTVPDGDALAPDFGPGGMPRLYTVFQTEGGPSLPSLWVFLIIVLGILLSIVTGSSLFMGFVQRRRRQALRRRVETGEVDLEALGIKRMTVPQSQIDKMPLYTFKGEQTVAPSKDTTTPREETSTEISRSTDSHINGNTPVPAAAPLPPQNGQFFSQTTCTICLDDYVSNETTVRELPCHHIFHPECVDIFLLEHSSACPVCKKSTLPDGFCPENITNAMVRREQLIRRIQDRRVGPRTATTVPGTMRASLTIPQPPRPAQTSIPSRLAGLRDLINVRIHQNHSQPPTLPTTQQPPSSQSHQPPSPSPSPLALELNTISLPMPPTTTTNNNNNRSSTLFLHHELNPTRRRELARQRAVANLSRQNEAIEQDIANEEQRLPLYRRVLGKVWPGYG